MSTLRHLERVQPACPAPVPTESGAGGLGRDKSFIAANSHPFPPEIKEPQKPDSAIMNDTYKVLKNPLYEAPRPQAGASRKRNIFLIVPLDPAYKAGLAGHLPVKRWKLSCPIAFFLPLTERLIVSL